MTVLHDNPPLAGKKFFIVSMISPEGRQKNDVHGIKIHDFCETEEEGRRLIEYYHKLDPDFDVFLGSVGKWCPWIFDPSIIQDATYADKQLTDLIGAHRQHQADVKEKWEQDFKSRTEEMKKLEDKDFQNDKANEKEVPVSMIYKIKQLEHVVTKRQQELEKYQELFESVYDDVERKEALDSELPDLPVVEPLFR